MTENSLPKFSTQYLVPAAEYLVPVAEYQVPEDEYLVPAGEYRWSMHMTAGPGRPVQAYGLTAF